MTDEDLFQYIDARFEGDLEFLGTVEWDIDAEFYDGVGVVEVTFDIEGLSQTFEFNTEQALEFLDEFDDVLREAKQQEDETLPGRGRSQ